METPGYVPPEALKDPDRPMSSADVDEEAEFNKRYGAQLDAQSKTESGETQQT